ncbi:MAG: saccharopine dehydrogenase C-terminal domain-containing protein [Bacillota bacterium]
MRALVLGAGMMGSAMVKDLVFSEGVDLVTLADSDPSRVRQVLDRWDQGKTKGLALDFCDRSSLVKAMREADVTLGAYPETLITAMTTAAIQARCHLVDLTSLRSEKDYLRLDREAAEAGVTIIPGCGVAPGLGNILAGLAVDALDEPEEAYIWVGGLPQKPVPPFNYSIVFSFESVIEEYSAPCRILRNGEPVVVKPLSGVEEIEFPPPVGRCEAFFTDGLNTLLFTLPRRGVKQAFEKTVRYPGHASQMQVLQDAGFFSGEPVRVGEQVVIPSKVTSALLTPLLALEDPRDVTVMRVTARGNQGKSPSSVSYTLIDFYDKVTGVTSMARTTSYTCSIAAQMVAAGAIKARGVIPPEEAFRGHTWQELSGELRRRGILIEGPL